MKAKQTNMKADTTNMSPLKRDINANRTDVRPQDIDNLLHLFMEGQTSEAQEHALKQYFLTHKDLPAEWEPYRVLFLSFDTNIYDYAPDKNANIPNIEDDDATQGERPFTTRHRKWAWRRIVVWSAGVAAALIAAFLLIGRPRILAPAGPQAVLAINTSVNDNQTDKPNQTDQPDQPDPINHPNAANLINQSTPSTQITPKNPNIRKNPNNPPQPAANQPNPADRPNQPNTQNNQPDPLPNQPDQHPINPVTIKAHQQKDVAVLQENDLPITNPDALRLTSDDRTQMARLDAQRFIELLRIDLENQKYEINHPSEIEHIVVI